MSDERATKRSGLLNIRAVTSKILSPDVLANKIENMKETERSTLKSVDGPAPYIPAYDQTVQPTFAQMKGIFHGRLRDGQKEVLLATAFNGTTRVLLTFRGWSRSWAEAHVWSPNDGPSNYPEFPTQFEQCPNGIVVISQHDATPRFYDEDDMCSPLGYTKSPGAPSILGPTTHKEFDFSEGEGKFKSNVPNSQGFCKDANIYSPWSTAPLSTSTQMNRFFGKGRVGTTHSDGTVDGASGLAKTALENGIAPGILLSGAYSGSVQWVDKYGNFSALSPRSNTVSWTQMSAAMPDNIISGGGVYEDKVAQPPSNLLKQLMWQNISVSKEDSSDGRTIGRNIYRTKDILNSSTGTDLYLLPSNSDGGVFTFSTIPDNQSEIYVDNAPDGWLVASALDVVPMQRFRLCRLAFGRMFFANSPEDSGLVRYSAVGRWGTLLKENVFYPDPTGGPITGMTTVKEGLLVFTESSSFLITDTSQETGFAVTTLSTLAGCVAPSSISTIEDGTTIWLGKKAFYSYSNGSIQYFSDTIREDLKYVNTSRECQAVAATDIASGEYRCWVAMDSSKVNNKCFVYDGRGKNTGWRTRTDISASAVCSTKDHRGYMLATGSVGTEPGPTPESVYILDKEVPATVFALPAKTYTIETNWLLNEDEYDTKSPITVYVWMLETSSKTLSVEVYRDWRKSLVHTETVSLYFENDPPPFLGTAALDGGDTIRKSRPYWCKAKVFVPSCEVFKIILTSSDKIEFVGLSYDYVAHPAGGARVQK